jgi:hypothetical protein
MAKAKTSDLLKSHDNMMKFLQSLIKYSDTVYNGHRTEATERSYRKAVRLVAKAKELRS